MYLHCHDCGWEQDDFWSEDGYNPFSHINFLTETLFKDRITNVQAEKFIFTDMGFDESQIHDSPDGEICWVDAREYVAHCLERKANSIRNMAVKTLDDWREVKGHFCCPKCGCSDNLDLD